MNQKFPIFQINYKSNRLPTDNDIVMIIKRDVLKNILKKL